MNHKKPKNPPAFPRDNSYQKGMTLRDYFAAAAMNAGLNHYGLSNGNEGAEARNAYRMADAMLKERES